MDQPHHWNNVGIWLRNFLLCIGLVRVLNMFPTTLGTESQGFLDQILALPVRNSEAWVDSAQACAARQIFLTGRAPDSARFMVCRGQVRHGQHFLKGDNTENT